MLWATLLETLQSSTAEPTPNEGIRYAAYVSIAAAGVDYGLMPKRLTPGSERPTDTVGSRRLFGMACGLAAGGVVDGCVL